MKCHLKLHIDMTLHYISLYGRVDADQVRGPDQLARRRAAVRFCPPASRSLSRSRSCPWVGLTNGLGWVGSGHKKWTGGQLGSELGDEDGPRFGSAHRRVEFSEPELSTGRVDPWVGSGHTKWTRGVDSCGRRGRAADAGVGEVGRCDDGAREPDDGDGRFADRDCAQRGEMVVAEIEIEVGFNCDRNSSARELSVYGTVYRLLLSRLRQSTFSRRGWMIGVKMWIFKASASRPLHLQVTSYKT